MPKMRVDDLKALLASEHNDALTALTGSSKLSKEREDAMHYYLGDMTKDMPPQEGRSRAVSNDVSDTIEGMMPDLMEVFTAGDEIVEFNPMGPNDENAAAQETDYLNHVFYQQNGGFLTLYSFIKDALLSKVGVVKVFWEKNETQEKETYFDLTTDELALLLSDPDVEVIAHTRHAPGQDPDEDEGDISAVE